MHSRFDVLERRIARMLSDFPRLKSVIKLLYSRTVYLAVGARAARSASSSAVSRVGADDVETFFGYYDKSPVSTKGWLLCHTPRHPSTQPPQSTLSIAVQVFDFDARELAHPVMSLDTHAYNWQQGARAHWLDGEHFIFNDFDAQARRYISRVHCVRGRSEVQRYDRAVQDSHGREYFLAINYQRLHTLRPDYGYRNLPPLDDTVLAGRDNDGIWKVEQNSGLSRLLYSFEDICKAAPHDDFSHARHKVNHVMISPDGQRFIFLHRYFLGRRKVDRLMLGAADGSALRVLAAYGMVSHCFWMSDAAVLCYARGPSGFDGYYILDICTGHMDALFGGALDIMGDGHPHVHGHWFVTDSYPDRRRMQRLLRADLRSGQTHELGRFYQSFRYGGETRCDLHPRITPDGRYVFFDSVYEGRRGLYFLELS
ncbi:MAG: glycosyl transferase [Alcaligenaceae bacterium]|nr:glycosyl transferase [Alcaligenaceae bacterium]